MAFSDSSRSQLAYVKESVWGQTPASALIALRFTGESLNYNVETATSNQIRDDRQVDDLVRTGASATGGFNFEWSFQEYDSLLEGALFSTFSAALAVSAATISADATTKKITDGAAGSTVFSSVQVGQWVKVGGFANAANNGYFKVTAVAANALTFGDATLVTEAAGPTVTVKGSMIRNGTTMSSFTLERQLADVAQYHTYRGMRVGKFSLDAASKAIMTGAFDFIGKDMVVAGATAGTGAQVAATNNPIMNAVTNVQNIMEGGSTSLLAFKEFKFALDNKLRAQDAIGSLAAKGIGAGRAEVTGSLNAYFENSSLYQKYLDGAVSSLSYRTKDDAGNAYIVTLPKVKYTSGQVQAGGNDQDIMANMNWTALRDSTTNCMIQIDKFSA